MRRTMLVMQHTIFILLFGHIICLNESERTDSVGLAHRVSISIHSHTEALWPYFSLYVPQAWVADSQPHPLISLSLTALSLSLTVPLARLSISCTYAASYTQTQPCTLRSEGNG